MSVSSDRLEAALGVLEPLGAAVTRDGPLGTLTTYRVGGSAAVSVKAADVAALDVVAEAVAMSALPVLVVGRGSNLLVADAGFSGIAVLLDPEGFGSIDVDGMTVRAGAAVAFPTLSRQSVEAGLTGLEWAVGVPGSVGGGVRMNAGGHGSDTAHTLASAQLFRLTGAAGGRLVDRARDELGYGYRRSSVEPTDVVVEASFALSPGDPERGREEIREIVRWRREHQPGGQNAGSVFTNPEGESAGRLVEAAGLKGHRMGSAEVSPKHANFIQADRGGSADDVLALIRHVQAAVAQTCGVELRTEVRLVGFPPGAIDERRGADAD